MFYVYFYLLYNTYKKKRNAVRIRADHVKEIRGKKLLNSRSAMCVGGIIDYWGGIIDYSKFYTVDL